MAQSYEARMMRVLDYIHANPAGDLSLDQLADVAAMSRFHWHRVFHGMTGETCAQVVRRVRLHRAACWLVQTDQPIGEIAEKVGYPNQQSFTRAFRTGFGTSPGAFRKAGTLGPPPLNSLKGPHTMFDVEIRNTESRRLLGMPHSGPYLEIGQAFEKLAAIAASRNLWPEVRGMVGVYYDDPNAVDEDKLRSFAGLQVTENVSDTDGLEEVAVVGGDAAVLTFTGPYSGLMQAYDHLFGGWLPKSGREPRDEPAYEIYLNMPSDTAPEDLKTEIHLPLRSA
ncbi:AraC family transcriptional regulator [Aliiroseovarius sp. YM-037]|uniref:AraC family transcriptional regulator n=1 Tax=Aliiroseovarius sp. YM-037 TaxID=3341728 RepID=UPI003A7FA306